MSSIKLTDVAKEAGVAISTASIVLSESGQLNEIAKATQERIREVARRLKYRPNAGARLIQMRRSGAIALLQSAAMDRAMMSDQLLYGISSELQKRNQTLRFVQLDDDSLMESEPRFLRQKDVDGILVNYSVNMPRRLFDFISHYEIPSIFINVRKPKDAVWFDYRSAVSESIKRQAALGHRRILFLNFTGDYDHYSIRDALKGYTETIESLGLKPRIEDKKVPRSDRLQVALDMLRATDAPGAILTLSSSSAIPIIQAAGMLGIRIPGQLSICTFGSDQETSVITPQPAYISLPWQTAGRTAVQMLLSKIEETASKQISGRLKCEWHDASTTVGPIRNKK